MRHIAKNQKTQKAATPWVIANSLFAAMTPVITGYQMVTSSGRQYDMNT